MAMERQQVRSLCKDSIKNFPKEFINKTTFFKYQTNILFKKLCKMTMILGLQITFPKREGGFMSNRGVWVN